MFYRVMNRLAGSIPDKTFSSLLPQHLEQVPKVIGPHTDARLFL